MTDVLDRRDAHADEITAFVESEPATPFDLTSGFRLVLAATALGAGAIHLVMVPSHWGESVSDGLGFVVVGWLQILFAVFVIARPTRLLLQLGIALNVAAIGGWILSRTAGLPYGAHSGVAEDAGFVDVTCVALEGVLVVACIVALVKPRLGARHSTGSFAFGLITLIGVLALTTSALASPGARNHGSHSHDAAAGAGDGGAAHTHDTPGAAGDGHAHNAAGKPVDDKGFSALSNGHHAHNMVIHDLDKGTTTALNKQLAVTRELARQTPTVAAALAQGYKRVGPYFPGIGAHMWKGVSVANVGNIFEDPRFNADGTIDDVDLRNPLMLIFDGTKPTSKIAGFMYYAFTNYEPDGFIGRNDYWHYHEQLCLKMMADGNVDVPLGLDNAATPAECKAAGGMMLKASNYMVHVWSVPGFTMTLDYGGTFGEENPKLDCADGTYYMLPLDEWKDHPMDVCKAQ